jgi:hypothetical protein
MAIRIGRRLIEKDEESDRARKIDLASLKMGPAPTSMDMRPGRQETRRPSLAEQVDNLAVIRKNFNMHSGSAKQCAADYYNLYQRLLADLEVERAKVEEHTLLLDKLEAQLPILGGKDEKDPSDSAASTDDNTSDGKDDVSGTEI